MGQKDISLARYFEDQERYADLINGFVFGGKQIVSGEDVQEMDSRAVGVIGRLRQRTLRIRCGPPVISDAGHRIAGLAIDYMIK